MLRSLLISEIFPPKHGGSSRWFWEIYRRLPASHTLVAAGEAPNAAAFDATHSLPVARVVLTQDDWGLLRWSSFRSYWRAYRHLCSLVRDRRGIDSATLGIQAARCLPEGWLAWLLSWRYGVPYAVFVHGEDINTYATSRQLRWMVQRVLARATVVIANSQNTAQLLRDHWQQPTEKITVLYPGVDTQRFQPAPHDAAVRQQLGWTDRNVILTVGRLQARKGHDRLIQSLIRVRSQIDNVLYAIIGDGEERERLEQLVEQHNLRDNVQFLGATSDQVLTQAYQQCDLFALPNRTIDHDIEGFGMVLVEAQACGRPVLAGDSGGTRETMQPGKTGVIVDCTCPDTLAEELVSLLANPTRLKRMGEAARDWVLDRFDWESLFVETQQIFARVQGISLPQQLPATLPPSREPEPVA